VSSVHAALREDLVKKPLLMLAFALLAATPALAQVNLAWRNCIAVTTGSNSALANINYACDGTFAVNRLVVSFIAPPNVTQFIGTEFEIEISTPSAILPDFWRMGVGECREVSWVAPSNFSGLGNTTTCRNPFAGSNTLGGYQYTSGSPTAGKATALHVLGRDTPIGLTAGQQYMSHVITMDTYRDVDFEGSGVCAGCQIPACLTVTHLTVQQVSPLPGFPMTNADVRKSVTWQGGTTACAGETPARNHTWGAIKAIYR
jgi:hypothetical protein